MYSTPPVLFLLFNRPDLAGQVFERIRDAKPSQLFIAVDGPRQDRAGESELCAECRDYASKVDWPCEVKTLFREENLGCKSAVSSAITWFFQHVKSGIILEDDCLPESTFFGFCQQMLERYKSNQRLGVVTGNNFQPIAQWSNSSYYYSIYNHCWGWATWRDRWEKYDLKMAGWPAFKESKAFRRVHLKKWIRRRWADIFDSCAMDQIDTWDYQWTFSCWKNGYLTVTPGVNLVKNIGFDERATHTTSGNIAQVTEAIDTKLTPLSSSIEADTCKDGYATVGVFGWQRPALYLQAFFCLKRVKNRFKTAWRCR